MFEEIAKELSKLRNEEWTIMTPRENGANLRGPETFLGLNLHLGKLFIWNGMHPSLPYKNKPKNFSLNANHKPAFFAKKIDKYLNEYQSLLDEAKEKKRQQEERERASQEFLKALAEIANDEEFAETYLPIYESRGPYEFGVQDDCETGIRLELVIPHDLAIAVVKILGDLFFSKTERNPS